MKNKEYTHLQFRFRGGMFVEELPMSARITIDVPNKYRGVGNMTIHGKCTVWAEQWFNCTNFSTHFSNLLSIYAVSLCGEMKPILLWKLPNRPFSYKWCYRYAADILKILKGLNKK